MKAGHLKKFVIDFGNRENRQGPRRGGNPPIPPIGVIEVIHVAPRGATMTRRSGVFAVAPVEGRPNKRLSEKKMRFTREPISFNDDDLKGTTQLHDDVLVVTT